MSTESLGKNVDGGEHWAILTDAGIVDMTLEAEKTIRSLAERVGMDRANVLRFMRTTGWKLVRIQTTHKVISVCVDE